MKSCAATGFSPIPDIGDIERFGRDGPIATVGSIGPLGAGSRRQGVEMVDDGAAVDQCLTVVEQQCRDAAERVAGAHLNPVAEARKWPLLERYVEA
jgi:hypothetical protein